MLTAAGLGVPHEYFNPRYACELAKRWKIAANPLAEDTIGEYLDLLRRRRAVNGIFSTKLQYWQIDRFLRNREGYALFDGACVLHLYRSDVTNQFASWRRARATGRWDFNARRTTDPVETPAEPQRLEQALSDIEFLIKEDSGFRRLFLLLGIQPFFVTFEDIIVSPQATVDRIAERLGVSIDSSALAQTIAQSAPYAHDPEVAEKIERELTCDLREYLFRKE
jgi:LPS sulfotransferase NodH